MTDTYPTRPASRSLLPGIPAVDVEVPPLDPELPPWDGVLEQVGGVRLHVRRTAPAMTPEGAPTAVYVHGLGGSSTNWTDLGALLAPQGRGIAPDLPGFGYSEPDPGFDFSLSAHADSLADYIAGLDAGPVHLFGNSMGGAIVILLAARRPDLVRTLTLVSPAVPDLRPNPRRLSDPRMALAVLPLIGKSARRQLAMLTPEQRAKKVIELCFADPSAFPERRLAELAEEHGARMRFTWAEAALARSTFGILRDWLRPRSRSLWAVLPRVSAPTLVVWGEGDRVISAGKARRTVRLMPRARLLMLPNTGHVAQMERPVNVAQAVLSMWGAVDAGHW